MVLGVGLVFGVSASQAARPGELDPSFGHRGVLRSVLGAGQSSANAVALQRGKIVAAGYTGDRLALARFTTRGSLDRSFGSHGRVKLKIAVAAEALALAVQPDGKLVVVGAVSLGATGSNEEAFVARFNADGSLDRSFGAGFGEHGIVLDDFGGMAAVADAVAIQPDGKIVVAGGRQASGLTGGGIEWVVVRYRPDGVRDGPNFGVIGQVSGTFGAYPSLGAAVAVDGQGRILVGGGALSSQGRPKGFGLARLLPDGSPDPSFGTNGEALRTVGTGGLLLALALEPNGKIVAAGGTFGGARQNVALMRLKADGGLDSSFGHGGKVTTNAGKLGTASDVVLLPKGKIAAVGSSTRHGHSGSVVIRYRGNGSLDKRFGLRGITWSRLGSREAEANSVVLERGGKLVVAGDGRPKRQQVALVARYLNR